MGCPPVISLPQKNKLCNFPGVWKNAIFEAGVKNIPKNVRPVYGYLFDYQIGYAICSWSFSTWDFVKKV